jgi:hypothetical protein
MYSLVLSIVRSLQLCTEGKKLLGLIVALKFIYFVRAENNSQLY